MEKKKMKQKRIILMMCLAFVMTGCKQSKNVVEQPKKEKNQTVEVKKNKQKESLEDKEIEEEITNDLNQPENDITNSQKNNDQQTKIENKTTSHENKQITNQPSVSNQTEQNNQSITNNDSNNTTSQASNNQVDKESSNQTQNESNSNTTVQPQPKFKILRATYWVRCDCGKELTHSIDYKDYETYYNSNDFSAKILVNQLLEQGHCSGNEEICNASHYRYGTNETWIETN